MSRRRITAFSVIIALLMVAALFMSFFLSGWSRHERPIINLPPKGNQVGQPNENIPDPGISFAPNEPLELGVSSAQEVIATLSRPSRYQCEIQVRWYWSDGDSGRNYTLSVRDDLFSIEQWVVRGRVDLKLLGDNEQLLWWTGSSGVVVYGGQRGEISPDDLCAVPTYEDLLELPDDAFLDIGYQTTEQGRFLAVRAFDGTYYGNYFLSIDTGLLHQAFFYDTSDATEPVYRMDMTRYKEGDPGDEAFAQPNE